MRKAYVCLLLVLLVAPLTVRGDGVKAIMSITPDRQYYQVGDTILVHIKWNGTDFAYFISLGPYLRLREWRYYAPVPVNVITGNVTGRDPDQWWTIEVYSSSNALQTPTYYDIGLLNMTSRELMNKIHKDIVILNITMMVSEYTKATQDRDRLNSEVNALQGEVSRLNDLIGQYKSEQMMWKNTVEVARRFTKYFDYVKFVSKSITEIAPTIGPTIRMNLTVPVWYDPATDRWETIKPEDIMIEKGVLYYRVPWWVLRNETTYVRLEDLVNPENTLNLFMWNEWFSSRLEGAKKHYQELYTVTWIVPLGVAGAVVLASVGLTMVLIWWFRKRFREMEERGIAPPF